MAEKSSTLFILRKSSGILSERAHYNSTQDFFEAVSDKRRDDIISTIKKFASIPEIAAICADQFLDGIEKIIDKFPLSSIQECIDSYEREDSQVKAPEPTQEETSIPPELEALVAQYKENLAEKNINDGKTNSVAESVRRAREAMILRERLKAIRRNRAALSDNPNDFNEAEDKRYEDLIVSIVNPKAGKQAALLSPDGKEIKPYQSLVAPATLVITQAVNSYIENYPNLSEEEKGRLRGMIGSIVDSTLYLSLSGAVDISNHNDLITAIAISIYKNDQHFATSVSAIYAELDANEEKYNQASKVISEQQLQLSKLKEGISRAKNKEELEYFVVLIARTETNIALNINQRDTIEIDLTPFTQKIEDYYTSTTEKVISGVKKENGKDPNLDFDTAAAKKVIDEIHSKLAEKIQPRLPPIQDPLRQLDSLERLIRSELPQVGINFHATFAGQQAAMFVSDPKTQSKDLSGQAILLYSKGLTTRELDYVIAHASAHWNDPNSPLGKLYSSNPNLFGTLRQQLASIEKTTTPDGHVQRVQEVVKNIESKDRDEAATAQKEYPALARLSQDKAALKEYLELARNNNPKKILEWIEKNKDSALGQFYSKNKRLFGKLNGEFSKIKNSALGKEIGKPLGKITKTINSINNRISSRLTKISGFFARHQSTIQIILDPVGYLKKWLGHKAGQFIMKRVVKPVVYKLLGKTGLRLLQVGLKETAKRLARQAAERIAIQATKAAVKLGLKTALQAAVQAANVIPGLGIILAVLIEVAFIVLEVAFSLVKKALNSLSNAITGENFSIKKTIRDVTSGTVLAITGGTALFVGFVVSMKNASVKASSSAMQIIVVSIIVGYFFYITTILVAPIISTLAQLEAMPSGPRASGDCIFPIHGGYPICNGPLGSTHSQNRLEAADFCSTNHVEIHAIANGVVIFAGNKGSSYGNFVTISTTASIGTFNALYAHMSEIGVGVGDQVTQDDVIGITGGTGWGSDTAWDDHLHLGYLDIPYNQCPAGGIIIPEGCADFISCGSVITD